VPPALILSGQDRWWLAYLSTLCTWCATPGGRFSSAIIKFTCGRSRSRACNCQTRCWSEGKKTKKRRTMWHTHRRPLRSHRVGDYCFIWFQCDKARAPVTSNRSLRFFFPLLFQFFFLSRDERARRSSSLKLGGATVPPLYSSLIFNAHPFSGMPAPGRWRVSELRTLTGRALREIVRLLVSMLAGGWRRRRRERERVTITR